MVSKFINAMIATSIMTVGVTTSAEAKVACPTKNEVTGAVTALNTVMRQSEKNYFVLTAQPAINSSNLDWLVITQASGNGFDAAFANGEKNVKSVMAAATDEPVEQQGFYICAYLSGSGMNVMTVAPQQQKMNFNPAMINFDSFKQN